jgi:hypothetical protein
MVIWALGEASGPMRDMLVRLGVDSDGNPRINAIAGVLITYDPARPDDYAAVVDALVDSPDPSVAAAGLQWRSHLLENAGDPRGAIEAAERALALMSGAVDGPWLAAMLHAHLAGLHMQQGQPAAAVPHARAAIPVLERLGALDDVIQLHSILAFCALTAGRPDEVAEHLSWMAGVKAPDGVFGGLLAAGVVAAELALATGDVDVGLKAYQDAAARLRAFVLPGHTSTGTEPWVLSADASALTAFAHYGTGDNEAEGTRMYHSCRALALRALEADARFLDYPICGMMLFALGSWGLLRSAMRPDEAARLLVLAERFAYSRGMPTMAWEKIAPRAEELAPGRIAACRAQYGGRSGPELTDEARLVVERIG